MRSLPSLASRWWGRQPYLLAPWFPPSAWVATPATESSGSATQSCCCSPFAPPQQAAQYRAALSSLLKFSCAWSRLWEDEPQCHGWLYRNNTLAYEFTSLIGIFLTYYWCWGTDWRRWLSQGLARLWDYGSQLPNHCDFWWPLWSLRGWVRRLLCAGHLRRIALADDADLSNLEDRPWLLDVSELLRGTFQ